METLFIIFLSIVVSALGGVVFSNFERITQLEREVRKLKLKQKQ